MMHAVGNLGLGEGDGRWSRLLRAIGVGATCVWRIAIVQSTLEHGVVHLPAECAELRTPLRSLAQDCRC